MVAHVVEAVRRAGLGLVVAVSGHQADRVRAALAGQLLSRVHYPDYATGLVSSLKAGIAALPPYRDGVLVCQGGMPALAAAHIERILAAFDPPKGRAICVPVHRGKRGNPVLLGREFFPELAGITGDSGLIARHDDPGLRSADGRRIVSKRLGPGPRCG